MSMRQIDEFDREAEREARALRRQREVDSKPRAERKTIEDDDRIVRFDDGRLGLVINGKIRVL